MRQMDPFMARNGTCLIMFIQDQDSCRFSFFLLVAELGRSGTLDVDRVLTHCSTSSRTSRDSKMPSASSDSGGYGQITALGKKHRLQ